MIPWIKLASAAMPGGGPDLRLMRRGDEFSIMTGPVELMNSRLGGSEEALATMTCARLGGRAAPHLLIGGLGMGFTLRAALAVVPPGAILTVAELVPEVIAWARAEMAPVFGACLDAPGVRIHEGDVGGLIRGQAAQYDAILLDVDNGPTGLSRKSNDSLYDEAGLAAAHRALRPGGVLSVWSSGPDTRFTQRLRRAGFAVDEVTVRARKSGSGSRHVIWFATKTSPGRS